MFPHHKLWHYEYQFLDCEIVFIFWSIPSDMFELICSRPQSFGVEVERVPTSSLMNVVNRCIQEDNMTFLHSYDDLDLIAGHARYTHCTSYIHSTGIEGELLSWSDNRLKCNECAGSKSKRQRMFFLRKLNHFRAGRHILQMSYKAVLQCVLSFLLCTIGNMEPQDHAKLQHMKGEADPQWS